MITRLQAFPWPLPFLCPYLGGNPVSSLCDQLEKKEGTDGGEHSGPSGLLDLEILLGTTNIYFLLKV